MGQVVSSFAHRSINMTPQRAAAHYRKTRRRDEFKLTCAIADYLDLVLDPKRARFTHIANGEKRDAITGAKLKRMGVRKGWPDFILVCEGGLPFVIFMEAKAKDGSESPAQKEFGAWSPYPHYVVRSVLEVQSIIDAHNVPTKARVR